MVLEMKETKKKQMMSVSNVEKPKSCEGAPVGTI